MEHRTNDSNHYGQPWFHDNLFCNRNKFQRLFEICIRDGFRGSIDYGDSFGLAIHDLRGRFINAHG